MLELQYFLSCLYLGIFMDPGFCSHNGMLLEFVDDRRCFLEFFIFQSDLLRCLYAPAWAQCYARLFLYVCVVFVSSIYMFIYFSSNQRI